MTLDTSQLGTAGELALKLYALITSEGEVELYSPVVDDDHVDLVGAIRGGLPVIGLQVKTEDHLDKGGQVEARASYPPGTVREDPAFSLRGPPARVGPGPDVVVGPQPRLQPACLPHHGQRP